MRVSVSTKALAVVGCLAATSMTLGVTAYLGLRDLRVTGERVATFKDFEITRRSLEQQKVAGLNDLMG